MKILFFAVVLCAAGLFSYEYVQRNVRLEAEPGAAEAPAVLAVPDAPDPDEGEGAPYEESRHDFGFSSGSLVPVYGAELTKETDDSYRLRLPSAEWSCGVRIEPPQGRRFFDLSRGRFLALDVENLSDSRQMRLTMHISSGGANSESADHALANFTKNRAVNTGIGLNPGEKGTMRILLPHREIYASPDGVPQPYLIDTHHVNSIDLQVQWPYEDEFKWVADCRISNLRLEGAPQAERMIRPESFCPFIDEFGQFVHSDWPEKVKSAEELPRDLTKEKSAMLPPPETWDRYGGWKDGPQLRAAGNFRTEFFNGKWWLVTPDGHLFFSTGIDVIRNNTDSSDGTKHPDWYKTPVPESGMMSFPDWNLKKKFGRDDYLEEYYSFVQDRLDAWGINTIGNWSGRELIAAARKPYVVTLGENERSIPHVPGLKFYDCFDRNFSEKLTAHMRDRFMNDAAAKRAMNDPLCIGFFFDNEMDFKNALGKALKASYDECAAKRAFIERARKKYMTVSKLNESWGTDFADWEGVKNMTERPSGNGWREDAVSFETEWWECYFREVKRAISGFAPGKLYLGSRLVGFRQPGHLWRAAAKYCDVVTVNAYANSIYNLSSKIMDSGPKKPILVGEFHFGTFDRGMFKAGLCPVTSQSERARSYTRFVQGALCHPLIVGCHWFQYRDQPLIGRGDGEAYQIGFVDGTDRPYGELINASRLVGEGMYEYRMRGAPVNEMR